jgi:hypothetical protein
MPTDHSAGILLEPLIDGLAPQHAPYAPKDAFIIDCGAANVYGSTRADGANRVSWHIDTILYGICDPRMGLAVDSQRSLSFYSAFTHQIPIYETLLLYYSIYTFKSPCRAAICGMI